MPIRYAAPLCAHTDAPPKKDHATIYKVDDLVQGVGELHVPSSTEIFTWAGPHQVSMQLAASIARPLPPITLQCQSGATYVVSPGGYDKMWGRLKPPVVQQVASGPQ